MGATGGAGGAGGTTDDGTDGTGGTDGTDTTTTGGEGSTDTGSTDDTSSGDETTTGDPGAGGEFTLTSEELSEGGEFPEGHTCPSGGNMNFGEAISLSWSGAPAETQSFALVMIDVTLAESGGQFAQFGYHSAFWNLPASVMSLPAGSWSTALQEAGATALSEGYLGPCPAGLAGAPPPPHTYVFTLYALAEPMVNPGNQVNPELVEALEAVAIAKTTLSGISCSSTNGWESCGM